MKIIFIIIFLFFLFLFYKIREDFSMCGPPPKIEEDTKNTLCYNEKAIKNLLNKEISQKVCDELDNCGFKENGDKIKCELHENLPFDDYHFYCDKIIGSN